MRVELDAHELQALIAEYQEAQGQAAAEIEENPQESVHEKDSTKNLTIVHEEEQEETTILESRDVTKCESPDDAARKVVEVEEVENDQQYPSIHDSKVHD